VTTPGDGHLAPAYRRAVARRFAFSMAMSMIGANTLGALVVFVYLSFFLPDLPGAGDLDLVNTIVAAGYFGFCLVVGTVGSLVLQRRILRWFRRAHVLDDEDRRVTMRLPARCVRLYGALWGAAVVVFGALNAPSGLNRVLDISSTIAFGGVTTCALAYLLAERAVRPLVAEAMRDQTDPPPVVLGVRRRILLSWALGTGVPVSGIAIGIVDPASDGGPDMGGILFLCGVSLAVGLLAMLVASRSVSEPVGSVTRALAAIAAGDLDVRVVVDDVSEVGRLQSGVNAMVAGLRERERLRDLFGRQVGHDVAQLALDRGVDLKGERREVAVLFVDVVGSTGLAERLDPEAVVSQLNEFFGVVVGAVEAHGGWVDKFEGDAALCVFGAPVDLADPWTACLRAARQLAHSLVPLSLEAAVGVSGGTVVAGHVGTASRFEYTVIGDPVNAAARLTELAKQQPCVLADAAVVSRSSAEEQEHWASDREVVLRGRSTPTVVLTPRG
jgi:adenylate cyclase